MIVKMFQADGSTKLYDGVQDAHVKPRESVSLVRLDGTRVDAPITGHVYVMNEDGVTVDRYHY
jgi:hypothetical protein